ncbi:MAG TPA: hypothetical protein DCF84_05750 [Bacteroidetes bacterium]|nr:hypothetical protein [Bacteroidota bacterium]|tara:strand:- start:442 stop:921 length:480 start_codon:yes stop_codon:yes gene_type:complete
MKILQGFFLCFILFVFACSNDDGGNAGPGDSQGPCELNVPSWLQGAWYSYEPGALDSANGRIEFSETGWLEYDMDSALPNPSLNDLCATDSCFLEVNDASLDASTYEVAFVFADSCVSSESFLGELKFQFENVDGTRVNITGINTSSNVTELVSVLLRQ